MESKVDLNAVDAEVRRIKSAVEKLSDMGENFPSIARNAVRIQACVKMLELNISDCLLLEDA
ncbi:MAG: hypothetical protein P8X96_12740 [Desulfobacteraceae bacterium]|jgi:hypothetical protein